MVSVWQAAATREGKRGVGGVCNNEGLGLGERVINPSFTNMVPLVLLFLFKPRILLNLG